MDINPLLRNLLRSYGGPAATAADGARSSASSDAAAQESPGQSPSSPDSLALSAAVRDFPRVRNAVSRAPDVRSERVGKLRDQVQNGSYQVNVENLAQRLVNVLFPA